MIKLKFKLLGKTWKIRVLSKKKFKKKYGKNDMAVTWSDRIMDFSPRGCDIETIRHELVHAYNKEMCIGSVEQMTSSDMEEWIAELIGRRGPELLNLADKIYLMIKSAQNDE